ncbi:hypothetical protein AB205_0209250 [Aquarana catesbeiana]|uniref:Uncharacterized protein n=1 Tax=Aquarana catesbeiana TaxID=8400 RepID=A0A2G9QAW1_AQUCT|nr:hypothetical protein AB205_0209250 [Aquarana catesbeiana]
MEHSSATPRPQVNRAVTPYVPNHEDPGRVQEPSVEDSTTLQCINNEDSYNLIPIRDLLAEGQSRTAMVSPCVSEEASGSSQCTWPTVEKIVQEEEDTGDDIPEVYGVSRIQYTNWASKTRLHMRKGGLYERHSLKAPMLKEFATYLHETLEMENYKQEV